jgi:hypothetical protein
MDVSCGASVTAHFRRSGVMSQYFSVNNDNAIILKYADLRSSAVRRFSKSEQLPEDDQVRPKHAAVVVILMLL